GKTRLLLCLLLAGALVAAAGAMAWRQLGAPEEKTAAASPGQEPARQGKVMSVKVRVVDADGKPVPDAQVAVVVLPKDWQMAKSERDVRLDVLAEGKPDRDGRLRLEAPRPAGSEEVFPGEIVVRAEGHGVGMYLLTPDSDRAEVVI